MNERCKYQVALFAGEHRVAPNLSISLMVPWLKHPFFNFCFIFVNDSDSSHQRFTLVIPCSENADCSHRLFLLSLINSCKYQVSLFAGARIWTLA